MFDLHARACTQTSPDSTMGKFMEKAGGMLHSQKIEQAGAEKRDKAGAYGDSSDSYGSGNQGSDY